jgi:hypothetical protein
MVSQRKERVTIMNHRPITIGACGLLLGFAVPGLAWLGTPPPPELKHAGGVPYVSGGVGKIGRQQIASIAADHNLKLVFSLDTGAYLANVYVAIRGSDGDEVLHALSIGPWFFADLPPGGYHVTAMALGRKFDRNVQLGTDRTVIHFAGWTPADSDRGPSRLVARARTESRR